MPNRLSLSRMAEFIRNRQLAPTDLVDAHLRQIEQLNPKLNAFIEVYGEQARQDAREAEAVLARREPLGPLHGVPVTIKDSFDIAGRATACGSRLRATEVAQQDSVCVARLRRAGAIILGKTSCPEFLMNYETDNHLIGRTNNPWNEERTAGGSSGGEAAAIASLCSAGGMGSDGGGSIREPAHFCGITGLKPTPGRVPAVGHWPEIAHPGGLLGVGGPMARNAADLRMVFSAVEGYHSRDPFSVPGVPDASSELPSPVGFLEGIPGIPVHADLRAAVRRAAILLEQMGFPIVELDLPFLPEAHELWRFLFVDVNAPLLRAYVSGREEQCHRTGLELIDTVKDKPAPSAAELCGALLERDRLRAKLLERMEEVPLILAPACGVTAFPHGVRNFTSSERDITLLEAMAPLTFANLLGLPALALPVGLTPDGLPAGVQLVGRPWSEDMLLETAIRFERSRGPFAEPPGAGHSGQTRERT